MQLSDRSHYAYFETIMPWIFLTSGEHCVAKNLSMCEKKD